MQELQQKTGQFDVPDAPRVLMFQMFLVFLILEKLWPEIQRSSPCTSLEAVSLVWATGPVSIDSFFHIPLCSLGKCGSEGS